MKETLFKYENSYLFEYFKYVSGLKYKERPDYSKCREFF